MFLVGKKLVKEGEKSTLPLPAVPGPADVLLVSPPLAALGTASLGLHLLQASCRESQIEARVLYSNFHYAELVGTALHSRLVTDLQLLLTERLFAAAAYGDTGASIGKRIKQFSDPTWAPDHLWPGAAGSRNVPAAPVFPQPVTSFRNWLDTLDLEELEALSFDWLTALTRRIAAKGYIIVGCTTTLGGLAPAVALLAHVKKVSPDIITVLGGALCEGPMAEGILSLNTGIDYIFSGEGEVTFPWLTRQVLVGELPESGIIHGEIADDLDLLPLPDYQDYLDQRESFKSLDSSSNTVISIPFETSRGCWHGHCTFCGLNGQQNRFRSKSPTTVIRSLDTLVKQHNIRSISMTDNMMPSQYFDTIIPRLPIEVPGLDVFYEQQANLTLEQVISLKKAGVKAFQSGIESLSASFLRRMQKPYSIHHNIALLRYARSCGLELEWALLFGFPGDSEEEYREMLDLFPLIRHLQPPRDMQPLMLTSFSKYLLSPEAFEISQLKPASIFEDVLPPHGDREKLAYFFSGRFPSFSRQNPEVIDAMWQEFQDWQRAWSAYRQVPLDMLLPTLHMVKRHPDRYILEDSRGLPGHPKRREMGRDEARRLLVACSLNQLNNHQNHEDQTIQIRTAIDTGLGVVMDSWFIPLATADPQLLLEFEND